MIPQLVPPVISRLIPPLAAPLGWPVPIAAPSGDPARQTGKLVEIGVAGIVAQLRQQRGQLTAVVGLVVEHVNDHDPCG